MSLTKTKLQEEIENVGMINNVDKLDIEDGIRGSAQMALSTALKDSQRHRRAAKEMNDNQEAEAKEALSREISNKEHPEPLDYLKPNSQIELKESLFESIEDTADKVFKVTYKESPEIFSAVMIKASNEDEAKEKLSIKKPGKIIVDVEMMSDEAVKDMTSRGMSLMEDTRSRSFDHHDPDSKEPDGSEADLRVDEFDKSVDELNKSLLRSKEPLREDANSSEEELSAEEEECIEETPVAVEEQPSTELICNGVANELSALIKDEWEAIEGYKNTIVNLQSIGGFDEIVSVLEEIAGEEYVHVGQLQKLSELFSPQADKIADGQEEAERQLSGESAHSEENDESNI